MGFAFLCLNSSVWSLSGAVFCGVFSAGGNVFAGVQIGWQVVVLMYVLWRVFGFRFFFAFLRF